eukprot:TRINITY_DN26_c0_g1_i2.p1 TRINITY_DN26_c0_g1~~TRINITY_DN26_c0_g1_i2.p1  ORF type:complete len:873 (+),score=283.63 TRINITY_DN26_c0_g1_i2:18-2636(+)
MSRGSYARSVFLTGLVYLALCLSAECATVGTTIQDTDTRALKEGFGQLSLDNLLQLDGIPSELKDSINESLGDVDQLLEQPGLGRHLHDAFTEAFHGHFKTALEHDGTMDGLTFDRLLQMDESLENNDKTELKNGVSNLVDNIHSVEGLLGGQPRIVAHQHRPRNPAQVLEFLKRTHKAPWVFRPVHEAELGHHNTFLVKIHGEKGRSSWYSSKVVTSSFWVRYSASGGWEWSPKGADTCFAFVKTKEPNCWFKSRSDVNPMYLKLVDVLHKHQAVPLAITNKERPSTGETVMALGYGFVNGLFMGMGDMFRDAFRHPDCNNVGPALKAASHHFKLAFKTTAHCVKDTLTLKKSQACHNQARAWRDLIHHLKALFTHCKTLQRTVGVLLAVVLVAVVAIQVVSMAVGSMAGPIGTLIGAAVGVVVKVAAIVLAAVFGLHFMAKTVKKFLGARRRCSQGPCTKRDVIWMIEAAMEMLGVWVGIITMSGLNKVIEMPKFRALFQGQRPRFHPKFLKELESLKIAYRNAKAGRRVPPAAVGGGVVDDATRQAKKSADDAADDAARKAQQEADDAARKAQQEADEAARRKAQQEADEAARKAQQEADEAARRKAQQEADEAAKAAKVLDDSVRTPEKSLKTQLREAEDAVAQRRLDLQNHNGRAQNWKPGPAREYTRAEHVGNGKFESRSYGKVAQYNPHTGKTGRYEKALRKAMERVDEIKAQSISSSKNIDEAAQTAMRELSDEATKVRKGSYTLSPAKKEQLAAIRAKQLELAKQHPEYILRDLGDDIARNRQYYNEAKAAYKRSGSGYYSDRSWAKGKEYGKTADKLEKLYLEVLNKCDVRCKNALADLRVMLDTNVKTRFGAKEARALLGQ